MSTRRSVFQATSRLPWPKAEEASHAVREYLAALDAARSSEDNDDGDGGGSSGSRSKPAKEVSLTDPQAGMGYPAGH